MKNKTIYFSGLNGLRAIAAIGVVVSHITLGLKEFNLNPFIFGSFHDGTPRGLSLAGFGVSIFFSLSGFLITYLLQSEKQIQNINIKSFYMRRILRIWPLYYLYFVLCMIAIMIFGISFNIKSLFLYLFYAANIPFILNTPLPFLIHYWSLGVEEQFYLFWPWLNKKVNSKIIPFITTIVVIIIGIKLLLHFYYPNTIVETAIHVTRFHCMMIGALGAILYKQENVLFFNIVDNKLSQILSWIVIFLVAINQFHVATVIDNEIISLVTVFLIIGQIKIKNRILNLETNLFDFLGKISYGIYVIHPLLIFMFSKILSQVTMPDTYKYFIVYFSIFGTTILIAHLSYKYFEKYFLNLKEKYSVVKSSATMHFGYNEMPGNKKR